MNHNDKQRLTLVFNMFLCFSLSCSVIMTIQCWAIAPNRHNPGRQINRHNPSRQERSLELPTTHKIVKGDGNSRVGVFATHLLLPKHFVRGEHCQSIVPKRQPIIPIIPIQVGQLNTKTPNS